MPEELDTYFVKSLFALLETELKAIKIINGYTIDVNSFYDFLADTTALEKYLYPAAYAIVYDVKPTQHTPDGKIVSQDIYIKVGIVASVSREESTQQILNIIDSLSRYFRSENSIRKIQADDMSFSSFSIIGTSIINVTTEEFVEVQYDMKVSVKLKVF